MLAWLGRIVPWLPALIDAAKEAFIALWAFRQGEKHAAHKALKDRVERIENDLEDVHNMPRTRRDNIERLRDWRKKID